MRAQTSQNSRQRLEALLVGLSVLLLTGCSKREGTDPVWTEVSNAPATYPVITAIPSTNIPRARPMSPTKAIWTTAPFAVVQTELSPASLIHCESRRLSLFAHLQERGLGAPSYAAFGAHGGPRIVTNGHPADVNQMNECWVLTWFAGAPGWTNWDSPWVVFLQHKPSAMTLDTNGLHFEFSSRAGDVALMPLYGYFKPPAKGNNFRERHGLPDRKIKTWQWSEVLPREPLMRARYWASATREFPIYCEDSFSVDRTRGTVTIRQRFQWHSIQDDWNTKHLKLAPLSPTLALAALDGMFPVRFSGKLSDLDLPTPYGPYAGIEGADVYDATFSLLQYINLTEAPHPLPLTNTHPSVAAAQERLQKTAQEQFQNPDRYHYDHGGLENFRWAIQGDQWYAKALPYLDGQTRSNALAGLRKYFHDHVLVTNRFRLREFPRGSGRHYYLLEGPGIGSWGVLGDAGKFSASLLETLWAYAHFSGDWDLVKERWPLVKMLFTTPAEAGWAGFGRDGIAELGDEAAPCVAMARMAYRVGDLDTHHYACYMVARELVHHYVKQRGADYFRRQQPWHSMEFMDEEAFLTNLWGDLAGWQIDGPNYPAKAGERQLNRWVRFKDADVGRFYRDHLLSDVRRELNWLQRRWEAKRRFNSDSYIMPSLVQLRSLLLNETPIELADVATPDQFTGPPSSVIANCLAVIRTSQPTRWERLIAGGEPSLFVVGLEREVAGPRSHLLQAIQLTEIPSTAAEQPRHGGMWPEITWWKSWKPPRGERWSFGWVIPGDDLNVTKRETLALNWNGQAAVFE